MSVAAVSSRPPSRKRNIGSLTISFQLPHRRISGTIASTQAASSGATQTIGMRTPFRPPYTPSTISSSGSIQRFLSMRSTSPISTNVSITQVV